MAVRKTIFVTGGGSGIGRAIAIRFANAGWFVGLGDVNEAGMAETEALLPGGFAYSHRLDVTDRAALVKAAEGCGAVVHAAAMVQVWAKDKAAFDRVNVGGLENAEAAARSAGARLLYVSSFMALGPTDGAVHDETTPRASTRRRPKASSAPSTSNATAC